VILEWKERLKSLANERGAWQKHARLANDQRSKATFRFANAMQSQPLPPFPLLITITRLGKQKLDTDNRDISAKHVRDGIADALGVDDGDETKVVWRVRQEINKQYRVRVEVETYVGQRFLAEET